MSCYEQRNAVAAGRETPQYAPTFVAMCVARQEIHQFDPQVTKVETFWEVFLNSIHVSIISPPLNGQFSVLPWVLVKQIHIYVYVTIEFTFCLIYSRELIAKIRERSVTNFSEFFLL